MLHHGAKLFFEDMASHQRSVNGVALGQLLVFAAGEADLRRDLPDIGVLLHILHQFGDGVAVQQNVGVYNGVILALKQRQNLVVTVAKAVVLFVLQRVAIQSSKTFASAKSYSLS